MDDMDDNCPFKIVSITTAAKGWFAVFHLQDHTIIYQAVAVWAVLQYSHSQRIVGWHNLDGAGGAGLCFEDSLDFYGYAQIDRGDARAYQWR